MSVEVGRGPEETVGDTHFSCSLTSVLLARVEAYGGADAVRRVLERAGSRRSREYLGDIAHWVSYDEALALWRAGSEVTHHPDFARAVGEDSARRLNGSQVAALLRSLGSPESVYRQIAISAAKYSTVTRMQATDSGPGFAEITATAIDGFPRAADHCAWVCGLLSQPTVLFGLAPANVEHELCAAHGAAECRYRVTWDVEAGHDQAGAESGPVRALTEQLEAMRERQRSMFATAADLIGADQIQDVLARITDRAAIEIRAPRYLLAIRSPAGEIMTHHRGFGEAEARARAAALLDTHPAALPESWLAVPVRSSRRDYGRLLACCADGQRFFAEERDLFEVYARYAASALDSATALNEAQQRYDQSSALLELARCLAAASTSGEVALRLAETVPDVVDCDRVGVYLWDPDRGAIVRRATTHSAGLDTGAEPDPWSRVPSRGGPVQRLLSMPSSDPIFITDRSGDPILRELSAGIGAAASIIVPLVTSGQLLGLLAVSVMSNPTRLSANPDLSDRLSGVAAQASTALQNARLVDQITYQARHDELTGLDNRMQFHDRLATAIADARRRGGQVGIFYLDLDGFKPVNDGYGHDVGDQLLSAVGLRLSGCVRTADLPARLGGDEFAVLLDPGADVPDIDDVAARLKAAFDRPFAVAGRELSIGASVGHAVFPADAETSNTLLAAADSAMYTRKRRTQAARAACAPPALTAL